MSTAPPAQEAVRLGGAPGTGSALLERAGELRILRQAVREAAAGGSATVVVHGRPGSGRSAVLAEAAALARAAGLRTVTAAAAFEAVPEGPGGPSAVLLDGPPGPPDAPAPRPGLLRVWVSPDPEVRGGDGGPCRYALELRPLGIGSVRALLTEAYGDIAADRLLLAAVTATGGNPAVLCGTLRQWPGAAPEPGELAALADEVGRHHIRRILDRASGEAVALVEACAVADGAFPFGLVCELAGIDPPHRERVHAEAVGTGLLGRSARPRPYHALVTERVLGLLDRGRRRELYDRAARLARRERLPEPVVGRLATVTRLSGPWVPAVLHTAGVRARQQGDTAAAVTFLERALDLGARDGLRAHTLLELARAQSSLRPEVACRHLRRVLTDPAPEGFASHLAAADLLALYGGQDAVAVLTAAAAGAALRPEERRALAGLRELARGTVTAAPTPPGNAGPAPVVEADDGSRPVVAAATAWQRCRSGRGIDEARRLAGLALARNAAGLFAPRLTAARVLVVAEDTGLARAGLEQIEADARAQGMRPVVALALLERAGLALHTGDLRGATALLNEALTEVPRRHWHPATRPRLAAFEARLALERGRLDRAEAALADVAPGGPDHSLGWTYFLFVRGLTALHAGRTTEAATSLRECGRILSALGCRNPGVLPWRSLLALAELSVAPDTAAELLREDLRAARAWGAPGLAGRVHLCTGLAAAGPAAVRHLRTAARLLSRSAAHRHRVRALSELAAVLLSHGRPTDGRRALAEALAANRTLGSPPAPRTEEIAALFAALPRTSRARLSPAQLRVCVLAAGGRSNREIATELSVSLRTVELHLTNSYRALGIGGRRDLATVLGHAPPPAGHGFGGGAVPSG